MSVTRETFQAIVLAEPDGRWEIFQCRLREKPPMSFRHNETSMELALQLGGQVRRGEHRVRHNSGYLTTPSGDSYVPDVFVVPDQLTFEYVDDPGRFETYSDPVPFVAEVSSPSTGLYDIDRKMPGYQARGDLEIWRVHSFDGTVTMWRRQPDGSYTETTVTGGSIALHALPHVTIDLDA